MSLRSLPGMAGRCLRVGSAGKTFSFTAWKVRGSLRGSERGSGLCGLSGTLLGKPLSLKAQWRLTEGSVEAQYLGDPMWDSHRHFCPTARPSAALAALQVGWASGPAALVGALAKAHQFLVFTVPSAMQRAVAYGLDSEQEFYVG